MMMMMTMMENVAWLLSTAIIEAGESKGVWMALKHFVSIHFSWIFGLCLWCEVGSQLLVIHTNVFVGRTYGNNIKCSALKLLFHGFLGSVVLCWSKRFFPSIINVLLNLETLTWWHWLVLHVWWWFLYINISLFESCNALHLCKMILCDEDQSNRALWNKGQLQNETCRIV